MGYLIKSYSNRGAAEIRHLHRCTDLGMVESIRFPATLLAANEGVGV